MVEEWVTADTFDATRLNKKTRFVGTGLQATTFLTSPQVGQVVYPTLNDSTATGDTTLQDAFRHDKFSFYTSAGWKHHTPQETEYTTGNSVSTQVPDKACVFKQFIFHTLPSTDKWYKISALEIGHGTAVGDVLAGVDICDANPPTNNFTPLVALATKLTTSGVLGTATKVSTVMSYPIKAGSFIGIWMCASAVNSYGAVLGNGPTYVQNESGTGYHNAPAFAKSTGIVAGGSVAGGTIAIKCYYVGYS